MILDRSMYSVYFQKARALYQQPVMTASVELILSVFVVAIMMMFAIRPTIATVVELQKKITDLQTVDQKLSSKISSLGAAQSALSTYADKLFLYEKTVPDIHDLDGFSKRVELLVQESGVKISSLTFSEVPLLGDKMNLGKSAGESRLIKKGEIMTVEMDYTVLGSSEQLLTFLQNLEKIDRLVFVQNVSIQKQEAKDKSSGELKLTGKAVIYYKFT